VLGGELLFELVDGDLKVHESRIKGRGVGGGRGPFGVMARRMLSGTCEMLMRGLDGRWRAAENCEPRRLPKKSFSSLAPQRRKFRLKD
jgi:hypothetical protein